jgi:hypothetical protein
MGGQNESANHGIQSAISSPMRMYVRPNAWPSEILPPPS